MRLDGYAPIREYAAIGDGRNVALVASDGAVDWLTLPTLADGAVFAAILDAGRGGSFTLAPSVACESERRYLPETNVLETTFRTAEGAVRITDALTTQDGSLLSWTELVRRVEGLAGEVPLEWRVEPRFGLGRERVTVERREGVPIARGERDALAVLAYEAGETECSADAIGGAFRAREGSSSLLALAAVRDQPLPLPARDELELRLDRTGEAWRRWVGGARYDGPWRDAVVRSALALRLLTLAATGAIAAAPTTSLPERLGGDRNWDYRFAWVRDASFTLDALMRLGYREQVHASFSWLLDAVKRTQPWLQPMYRLDGGVPPEEAELELAGYRGSRPVRVGNGATKQLQLGCYGDLLETAALYVEGGNLLEPAAGRMLAGVADLVCEIWRNPDSGIWERRDEERHYTLSKLGCRFALERAVALAGRGQMPGGDADRWRREAAAIREFVETRCWSERRASYAGYADSDELDAGVLRAAPWGFADPRRWDATLEAIRAELGAGPLLYRYSGMRGREGAFLACSFWLVDALARGGRRDEAAALMDELVALANDVGLLSEQIDPDTRELLGNFPQGLTHLALINAAHTLEEDGDEQA